MANESRRVNCSDVHHALLDVEILLRSIGGLAKVGVVKLEPKATAYMRLHIDRWCALFVTQSSMVLL